MKRLAAVGAMKLSVYLKGRAAPEVFHNYKGLLDADVTAEELRELSVCELYADEPDSQGQGGAGGLNHRVLKLLKACGGNQIAETLLQLLVLRYMDAQTEDILNLVAAGNRNGVTLEAAAKVAGMQGETLDYLPELWDAYQSLRRILSAPMDTEDYIRLPWHLDERLIRWLMGNPELDERIRDYCRIEDAWSDTKHIYGFEEDMKNLSERLYQVHERRRKKNGANVSGYQNMIVHIYGEKESGRYLTACYVANACQLSILSVSFEFLLKVENPKQILQKILRECSLSECCLCVRDIYSADGTMELLRQITKAYQKLSDLPLFLTSTADVKVVPFLEGEIFSQPIPRCSAKQSLELWNGFLQEEDCEGNLNVSELASKMRLTAGQIKRTVHLYKTWKWTEESEDRQHTDNDNKQIYKLCYQVLDDGRYDNIKRVTSGFQLKDVKISDRNRGILMDICHQAIYRQKVYDDWNMSEKYTYGRCISAIFAGPPGTGKTMAVHALSSELGLELYKVDLSQIVDKYIGETQKRLEEVFSKAERSNMILFFDEADAVMGKRNEVKDSKDKYANTEIAYILQRMEEYDGIVILATNYLQNIDTAFMRRIRYVVNFDIPDRTTREDIWRSSFAEGVPLSDDLDFEFLAERFEYAGGNIKNIVLNATFYAAAEGKPVNMSHVIKALYRENTKDKQIAFTGDFGPYAYLQEDW